MLLEIKVKSNVHHVTSAGQTQAHAQDLRNIQNGHTEKTLEHGTKYSTNLEYLSCERLIFIFSTPFPGSVFCLSQKH